MAWIYSRDKEASPWPSLLGSSPSPTVRSTHMLVACSCRGWPTVDCTEHQFGTTLALFAPKFSPALASTSSPEDSPVRTFQPQDLARAWWESEAGFIAKSSALPSRYDRPSSSWRTLQPSETMHTWLSGTFPPSGMIVDGQLFQLPKLAPLIDETGGGSLLPTPTASAYGSSQNGSNSSRPSAGTPSLATRYTRGQAHKLLPTPTVADSRSTARASTNTGVSHDGTTLTDAMRSLTGKQGDVLSPRFVEWMMGVPIGWTDCDASVIQLSRPKPDERSKF